MLPPAPTTRMDFPCMALCLRSPGESGIERRRLRAEAAPQRVSPARELVMLVVPDSALRTAHSRLGVAHGLAAAPAEYSAIGGRELLHARQRLGGEEQRVSRHGVDLVAVAQYPQSGHRSEAVDAHAALGSD